FLPDEQVAAVDVQVAVGVAVSRGRVADHAEVGLPDGEVVAVDEAVEIEVGRGGGRNKGRNLQQSRAGEERRSEIGSRPNGAPGADGLRDAVDEEGVDHVRAGEAEVERRAAEQLDVGRVGEKGSRQAERALLDRRSEEHTSELQSREKLV